MGTSYGRFHSISLRRLSVPMLGLLFASLLACPSESLGGKVVFDEPVGGPLDSRILTTGSGGRSIDQVVQK